MKNILFLLGLCINNTGRHKHFSWCVIELYIKGLIFKSMLSPGYCTKYKYFILYVQFRPIGKYNYRLWCSTCKEPTSGIVGLIYLYYIVDYDGILTMYKREEHIILFIWPGIDPWPFQFNEAEPIYQT